MAGGGIIMWALSTLSSKNLRCRMRTHPTICRRFSSIPLLTHFYQRLPVKRQQAERCRPKPVNLPGPARTFSLPHWRRLAGPGAFDFKQGDGNGTLFWDVVRSFIHHPTAEQTACHHPKPVLLDTGNINFPYPW